MKNIVDFIFKKPRLWFLLLIYFLTTLACGGAILVLCLGIDGMPTYILYGFAALLLAYSIYTIVKFAPKIKRGIMALIYRFGFTRRLAGERDFRTLITSTASLVLNVAYSIFNIVIAIISHSLWYGAIGIYHLLLIAMRSDVLLSRNSQKKSSYIRCASFLAILSLFLSLAVWQMISKDLAFVRFGWTIYAYAAFAFYKITMAIIGFVKSRKNLLVTRALRFISLADASVSILTLQTSLLYTFGGEGVNKGVFNAITGAVVCALTFGLGIAMIIMVILENKRNNINIGNNNEGK
ncbi:MAG: hypothetical protein J6C61_01925 [Clostridia bacterium]|nr:hypothetical protein [Clostridia bacterium]